MPSKRSDRVQQVRTPDQRDSGEMHNAIMAHMRGEAEGGRITPGKDPQFEVLLPFGKASYAFSSLTPIGSGVAIPGQVDVDFSRDRGGPIRIMRIIVRQGVPMYSDIRLAARPDGRGLRPADLDAIDLANWIEDILSECTWEIGADDIPTQRPGMPGGRKAISDALRKSARRTISRELLARVADIYRANIDGTPIEVVQQEFGVGYRTAARYVEMCRDDEFQLLPKTDRGKRKA
jgi:hypothetical protein